jgi:hypothetical protein
MSFVCDGPLLSDMIFLWKPQHLMNKNATFDVKDVSDLVTAGPESDSDVEDNSFDFVTAFDAIDDQRDPKKVLRNI